MPVLVTMMIMKIMASLGFKALATALNNLVSQMAQTNANTKRRK